jgi:hypothetical protein
MQRDRDAVREAREYLVDRVVDDLVNKMMKSAGRRRPDVHARALAYCLESLEDLNLAGGIAVRLRRCLGHLVLHVHLGVPKIYRNYGWEGTGKCKP